MPPKDKENPGQGEEKKPKTMTVGIKMTRTEGCLVRQDHEGIKKPTLAKLTGYEAPDTIELTRGQLARLSHQHKDCTPSLQCLADVWKYKPSKEEEDEAEERVKKLKHKEENPEG